MGCGASTASGDLELFGGNKLAKIKPAFTSKEALKQIKKIEKAAPRKKLEDHKTFKLTVQGGETVDLPFAYVSQTGYYPDELDKPNQDKLRVQENIGDKEHQHAFFGVFDGHGKVGELCANFASHELLKRIVAEDGFAKGDFFEAIIQAHVQTNITMHEQEKLQAFSDVMSGTTAISAFFNGDIVFISNVGDSRAIALSEHNGKLIAIPLSIDQTPFRKDERERVKSEGARVLTMGQIEGFQDPSMQDFGNEDDDDGDPPRVWAQNGNYPGTAFTRSLGDRIAEDVGVIAIPEILERKLTVKDNFILLASDGVFEFITSQGVAEIFSRFQHDLLLAARTIVAEAYRQWLQFETRTDDITVIIIDVRGLGKVIVADGVLEERQGASAEENLKNEIRIQHSQHSMMLCELPKNSNELVKGDSFRLDGEEATFLEMELRPVRRKVANNVGVVSFDPSELEGYELPVFEKTEEERENLLKAMRSTFLFSHLNSERMDHAVAALEKITVSADQVIIKQFEQGDKFYIASAGRYAVEVAVNKTAIVDGKTISIEGEYEEPREIMEYNCAEERNPSFGELALMYNKPRAATIKARTEGTLWALERKAFHSILRRDSAHRLVQVLRNVQAFNKLRYNEVARLVDLLVEVRFNEGETVVSQGEMGDSFYVIKKGTAKVIVEDETGDATQVMTLRAYDYFGEKALINEAPRAASVVAMEKLVVLMIKKEVFDEVLGHLQEVIASDAKVREKAARAFDGIKSLQDLKVFSGKVPLHFGELYRAVVRSTMENDEEMEDNIKFVTLRRIIKPRDEFERASAQEMLERELGILKRIRQPTLIASFEHESQGSLSYQVFCQEFVGDLQTLIQERPLDPTSNSLKYTVKAIANTLVELQQNRAILCRGIAPEGILLDIDGRVYLSDFRYAKFSSGARTFTTCGTPEYMAPEQIIGNGHSFPVDWWSLGILIMELCLGRTPFADMNESRIYESITNSTFIEEKISELINMMDPNGIAFLRSLLTSDPEKRFVASSEDDLNNISFLSSIKLRHISPFYSIARDRAKNMMMQTMKSL